MCEVSHVCAHAFNSNGRRIRSTLNPLACILQEEYPKKINTNQSLIMRNGMGSSSDCVTAVGRPQQPFDADS